MGQVSLPGRMTMGSVGQSFVGVAGRKAMSHDFAVGADTQNSIRELPSLSGTSLPHGGRRPVKAQDDKLTVPSLAVNSGVIYRIYKGSYWGCWCILCDRHGCSSVACMSEGTSGNKL